MMVLLRRALLCWRCTRPFNSITPPPPLPVVLAFLPASLLRKNLVAETRREHDRGRGKACPYQRRNSPRGRPCGTSGSSGAVVDSQFGPTTNDREQRRRRTGKETMHTKNAVGGRSDSDRARPLCPPEHGEPRARNRGAAELGRQCEHC